MKIIGWRKFIISMFYLAISWHVILVAIDHEFDLTAVAAALVALAAGPVAFMGGQALKEYVRSVNGKSSGPGSAFSK
jgi:hypothetical protein